MYRLVRSVAFRLDPERAHALALRRYRVSRGRLPARRSRPVSVMGIEFPNVVGLAAGYDKDGVAWRGLGGLGFGHIEVGTVTPRPQPGNPRPRIFRLPADGALINRMGFPSAGAETVAARLGERPGSGPIIGVSIGPNGFTDFEQVVADYEYLVDRFRLLADYLAINVSSPNTPGLRRLESGDALAELLGRIVTRRDAEPPSHALRPPTRRREEGVPDPRGTPSVRGSRLVVKLSPDIDPDELEATVATIGESGIDGIVLTNTTRRRPGVESSESGGLSGAPLRALSLEMLRRVRSMTTLPLIASGGIMTVDDARERLEAGASLVQLFTGFVYRGPSLVRSIAGLSSR